MNADARRATKKGYDGAAPAAAPLCSPAEIVARSRRGDPAALETITRCYGERLLAVGRRRCAESAGDAVQVVKVNVDDEPELAAGFQVSGIPTMVAVHGGRASRRPRHSRPRASARSRRWISRRRSRPRSVH